MIKKEVLRIEGPLFLNTEPFLRRPTVKSHFDRVFKQSTSHLKNGSGIARLSNKNPGYMKQPGSVLLMLPIAFGLDQLKYIPQTKLHTPCTRGRVIIYISSVQ